jgi:hypothetical protein
MGTVLIVSSKGCTRLLTPEERAARMVDEGSLLDLAALLGVRVSLLD